MRILYDNIKTLHSTMKILKVIDKIMHIIMKIPPDTNKNIFLVISKRA